MNRPGSHCLVLLVLPALSSCTMRAASSEDQLCSRIAAFAASVRPGESHSVVLRGGWGGDTPETLMTHDCRHFGYAPGKALCAYLLPNTSWEFGSHNASRAAECLDSADRRAFIDRVDTYDWPVGITSSLSRLTDKSVQITVRIEREQPPEGRLSELSVLTLSAVRQIRAVNERLDPTKP